MLQIMDSVATQFTKTFFPNLQIHMIHVRIPDLPVVDSLRDLRQIHLNCLVKTSGVVTRRTNVLPQLNLVKYKCVPVFVLLLFISCLKCGYILGPFSQNGDTEVKPGNCPECQSKGPFSVNNEQTVYRNYQRITIQESPGTVPPGRVPRYTSSILLFDILELKMLFCYMI